MLTLCSVAATEMSGKVVAQFQNPLGNLYAGPTLDATHRAFDRTSPDFTSRAETGTEPRQMGDNPVVVLPKLLGEVLGRDGIEIHERVVKSFANVTRTNRKRVDCDRQLAVCVRRIAFQR